MFNLLVVDDESIIAEYISEVFLGSTLMGDILLDVMQANSAMEALDIMGKTHIDILLTDISMPKMDGIELLKHVRKTWKHTKVILMSGYDEFRYVQQAIRNDGIDYILKSEDEERFIASVAKAAAEIEQELRNEEVLKNAAESMRLADAFLREELIIDILDGEKYEPVPLEANFHDLSLELSPYKPVYMAIARVNTRDSSLSTHKEMYKVKTFVHEYFSQTMNCISVIYEGRIVWILQAKGDMEKAQSNKATSIWIRLDSLQKLCLEMFKLHVSFSAEQQAIEWDEISIKFKRLYSALNRTPLMTTDIILIGKNELEGSKDEQNQDQYERLQLISDARLAIKKMMGIDSYLKDGSAEEFSNFFQEIMEPFNRLPNEYHAIKEEAFFTLVSRFMSVVNNINKDHESRGIDLQIKTSLDHFNNWKDIEMYFQDIAFKIIELRDDDSFRNTNSIIDFIDSYVEENIDKDLSLNHFAEILHYHPFYLSRMFKEIKGENFSEYIARKKVEKAKSMLLYTDMKIVNIAEQLGFNHSSYFTRFFKKHLGLAPQEYRSQNRT